MSGVFAIWIRHDSTHSRIMRIVIFAYLLKAVIEVNLDLLDTVDKTGTYWTGHLSSENYALIGYDAAF